MSTETMEPQPATSNAAELEAAAARIDQAMQAVEQMPPDLRAQAMEMKAALDGLYRLGLKRMVERLKADAEGKRLLFAMVDEPEVRALLVAQGLLRPSVEERVRQVLERIQPYLDAEKVSAKFVAISPGGVEIEMRSQGSGCSSNLGVLEHEIEDVVLRQVPEVRAVRVSVPSPEPKLVPLTSLLGAKDVSVAALSAWHAGPAEDQVRAGAPHCTTVQEKELIFLRDGESIYAFENSCPHKGLSLERGMVDRDSRTVTCPWHGYRFDYKTGECLTAPEGQLHVLPVRVKDGKVEVRFL